MPTQRVTFYPIPMAVSNTRYSHIRHPSPSNISVSRVFLASLLEWLAKLFIPFCLINANHLVAGYCTKERSSRKNHCSCASPKWSRRRTSWYSRDFGRMSRGCSSISDTTWIRSKMCCNPASTP